jgi:hypothetical protein
MAYFVERYDRASLIWELPQEAHAYKNLADAIGRADHVNSTERDGNWAHMEVLEAMHFGKGAWARVVDENRRVWPTTVCPNCGQEVR